MGDRACCCGPLGSTASTLIGRPDRRKNEDGQNDPFQRMCPSPDSFRVAAHITDRQRFNNVQRTCTGQNGNEMIVQIIEGVTEQTPDPDNGQGIGDEKPKDDELAKR